MPVKVTVAMAPTTLWPIPDTPVRAVTTVAVPLHWAVPLIKVAVVGGVVAPDPSAVMIRWAPLAMIFVPVKVTVAAAPVMLLKFVRPQVWPCEPRIEPPEVYVGLFVTGE